MTTVAMVITIAEIADTQSIAVPSLSAPLTQPPLESSYVAQKFKTLSLIVLGEIIRYQPTKRERGGDDVESVYHGSWSSFWLILLSFAQIWSSLSITLGVSL